jgi:hypothetical protein
VRYDDLAKMVGYDWFDYQVETFDSWILEGITRACLYYRTGAGKSITSLAMMKLKGQDDVLVIAPPSTHDTWQKQAKQLSMTVETISHAKFRQKDYRTSRHRAVIADEFHMFGGHGGKGFGKFDTLAKHLQAPLILCSATPNYNDAERVYCIKHVLDPHGTKGGYIHFLVTNCNTQPNPFGMEPLVDEEDPFLFFDSAENFLRSLPGVYHVPDNVEYTIEEHDVDIPLPAELATYGYERRNHRMVASAMEMRHTEVQLKLIDEDSLLHTDVFETVTGYIEDSSTPVLIFANHGRRLAVDEDQSPDHRRVPLRRARRVGRHGVPGYGNRRARQGLRPAHHRGRHRRRRAAAPAHRTHHASWCRRGRLDEEGRPHQRVTSTG